MQAVLQRFAPNIPNLEQRTFGVHDHTRLSSEDTLNSDNNRDSDRFPRVRGDPSAATSPSSHKDPHGQGAPRGSSTGHHPAAQPPSFSGRIFGSGEYLDIGTTLVAEAGARVH